MDTVKCTRCGARFERGKNHCKRCGFKPWEEKREWGTSQFDNPANMTGSKSAIEAAASASGPAPDYAAVLDEPQTEYPQEAPSEPFVEDPQAARMVEKAENAMRMASGAKATNNTAKAKEHMQKAFQYLEEGLKIQPDHPKLRRMKERLMFQIV